MPARSPFAGCFGGDQPPSNSAPDRPESPPIAFGDGDGNVYLQQQQPGNGAGAMQGLQFGPSKSSDDPSSAAVFLPIDSALIFKLSLELQRPGGFRVPVSFKSEPQRNNGGGTGMFAARRHRHLNTIKLVKDESYALKLEVSNCFLVRSFDGGLKVNGRRLDDARIYFREGSDRALIEGRWKVPEEAVACRRGEREMLVVSTSYTLVSGAQVPVEIQLQCKIYASASPQSRWGKEFAGATLSMDIRTGRAAAEGVPAYHAGTGVHPKPVVPPAIRGPLAALSLAASRRGSLARGRQPRVPGPVPPP
eukprot:tig00000571_g2157.t1